MRNRNFSEEKWHIYRSSLIAVAVGILVIALICFLVLWLLIPSESRLYRPDHGVWYCAELELSLDFDSGKAVLHNDKQYPMITEFHSNNVIVTTEYSDAEVFWGTCVACSDDALQIRDNSVDAIYSFVIDVKESSPLTPEP